MDFYAVLDQVLALLRQRGRVSYRALKRQFDLDDAYLDDLKVEIIEVQQCARDQEGTMLVWTGDAAASAPPARAPIAPVLPDQDAPTGPNAFLPSPPTTATPPTLPSLAGERRQVTVLFADISGFTALAETMDPEEVRQVMNACFTQLVPVVESYGGTIDKFIGDEIMALFGAPVAYENDAERAVYTALAMMEALRAFNAAHGTDLGLHCGINTGLVIAGEIGTRTRHDYSVMGDAVNLAARLEDASARGQIFVGPETYRLTHALFTFEPLTPMAVKGKAAPVQVYRVLGVRAVQRRLDGVDTTRLTPLVGREQEVAWLLERWEQVKEGRGQMVLLSGEAGIGKSRLVQVLKDHMAGEPHTRWECRSSPYHQHTALYPITELFHRVLSWQPDDSPDEKLQKLERALGSYRLPLEASIPLFAPLLSLPLPAERYPPLMSSPQRQRQQTLEALLAIVLARAEQQPLLFVLEDLHWVDPTTGEWLTLLVEQTPTAAVFTLLTHRPDFQPPWSSRSYLSHVMLPRLSRRQSAHMTEQVAGGKRLPAEVLHNIVEKTDGMPLFIEEMTRAILEAGLLREREDHYELTGPLPLLAIPATLHDLLMARLD